MRRITSAATAVAAVFASAADWPQWRGPNRDGKSADTALLTAWPKEGPKLLWKLKSMETVGAGYGSPAVIGDKMYLVGREEDAPDGKEFCICLSVADGKQVWKTPLAGGPGNFEGNNRGHGPHCTPTVDGDRLYVLGVTGDLSCLGTAGGKPVWHKNLVNDFNGKVPRWGFSESVLVDGDRVICTPGAGTGLVALDKKTGATAWQCKEFEDIAGHSSIVPTTVGNVRQYVQQTMASAVGVRASDGKLLWKVGEIGRMTAVIPTPVVTDDGYVFLTAGYGAGCECYKLAPDGDGTKAEKVYSRFRTVQNHHGGVIAVGDHVFGHSDSAGWICFAFKKAEDEPVWRAQGVGKGAISYADGHFYCYAENDGTLALVKLSDKKWDEVGRFKISETSKVRSQARTKVWPHPVVANGKLFLRDYEILYCYDVAGSKNRTGGPGWAVRTRRRSGGSDDSWGGCCRGTRSTPTNWRGSTRPH